MMRAARVVRAQLRASIAMALQYRLEFAVEGALALLWVGVTLFPLIVVFGTRPEVAGWTFPEMLVVLGWFVALKGVLEGTLSPSLLQVIEHVRKGTLDFVLLKPADAQLLVSLSKRSASVPIIAWTRKYSSQAPSKAGQSRSQENQSCDSSDRAT